MNAIGSWWLDIKLGFRMLVKFPGLALAGGVGIAVAVAIAAGGFSVIYGAFVVSALPFEEGGRIISLEVWDVAGSKPQRHLSRDFVGWREELRSVRELSAFQATTPNLILPGEQPGGVRVAAMSASGFRVVRVRPLLGRYLADEDEREGAPPVVVLSESVWRQRLAGDAAVIGRTIRLGSITYSVVGVMPEGFAFPVNQRFWIPLRAASIRPDSELMLFGKLAPGATLQSAQAELTASGARAALAEPEIYSQLRPRVMPYAYPFTGLHEAKDADALHAMQGLATSLLILVCLNVAVLMYSRTAMRQGEIAVRTALGASRRRIVVQLFLEALVLSAVAAVAGVGIAALALRLIAGATLGIAAELPFWISFQLSPGAVLWAAALSVLAAGIVGVVPALKATRREVSGGLKGMRLSRMWTVLIVAQAGFAVALLPAAVFSVWDSYRTATAAPGFAAAEFLSAQIATGNAGRQAELIRRLEAEPGVVNVTFARVNPGDETGARIEAEGGLASGEEVRTNEVDANFFHVFGVPLLAGRGFEGPDTAPERGTAIVNQSLALRLFGGHALGRRIRYIERGKAGRWHEIAGIVSDFPAGASPGMRDSKLTVYHAAAAGQTLAVRLRGVAPAAFAGRLREIAAAVDPDLQLRSVLSLEEVLRREQWIRVLEGSVFGLLTLSVLALSAAGIYAMMSITVTQRRREVGIRIALGADSRRVVVGIFSRAMGQLAVGAGLGMAAAAALDRALWGDTMRDSAAVVLPVVGLLIMAVGLLGVFGPARRSLRIEPTEALREQ